MLDDQPELPFQNNTGLPWTASQKDKTCFFLRVYYREVKSLRFIENSHNKTLTFLFGAVLTDDFFNMGPF